MEEIVLGMLRLGPAHGYALRERIRSELGPAWRVGTSQLYARLRRLEEHGLVRGIPAEASAGPSRVVYALTPAGEERFSRWLRSPPSPARRRRGEHLVRLYFLLRFAPGEVGTFIAHERAALERRRARLKAQQVDGDPFREAVGRFRLLQVEGGLRWLAELEEMFGPKEGR
ncbi:MAG: PadR family transcriptional regulator [Candidatus Bipolaricaulota bacterium]|nr:PadR family transcriptional regulator [Candidatus Bipolaricaulota bacterium]